MIHYLFLNYLKVKTMYEVFQDPKTGEQKIKINAIMFAYPQLTELRKRCKVIANYAELDPKRNLSEELKTYLLQASAHLIKMIDNAKKQAEKSEFIALDPKNYQPFIDNFVNDGYFEQVEEAVAKAKRKAHNDAYRAKQLR